MYKQSLMRHFAGTRWSRNVGEYHLPVSLVLNVATVAEPHATMEDDIYEGYMIPKGSIIVPNSWYTLNHSRLPSVYS